MNIPFVCQYNSEINMNSILNENWGVFANEDRTRTTILPKKPRVSYKHHKNLAEKLVRANLDVEVNTNILIHPTPGGITERHPAKNIKCRLTSCGTCPIISNRSEYYSFQTKIHYSINNIYSCDTKGGIYLLECNHCGKQYVGESGTTIRNRMKHHRNASKARLNRPIYEHIQSHNKESLDIYTLTIIDQIADIKHRKEKEMEYIMLLKTKIPFGLNVIRK